MLVLIRGIPGSGKSTFAKEFKVGWKHFEADDFWEGREFSPKFLHLAHKSCQEKTREALEEGFNVVVANTFVRTWEMQPYFDMTDGLAVVYRMDTEFKSIHDVPQSTIDRMKKRFEDYPGEIRVT